MRNIKKTYILFSVLIVFLALGLCVSFAFLTNKIEQKGKLNIVAGTLDYKIKSDDLENNKITVGAGQTKELVIELTSLNDIDSKYELYYTLDTENEDVEVGYSTNTSDSISGTINAKGTKEITVIIRNSSDTDTIVTFNAIGGLEKYELVLNQGNSLDKEMTSSSCKYAPGTEFAFDYTGSPEEFVVPCDGIYKLEVWGAQGGTITVSEDTEYYGGYGAYSTGSVNLQKNSNLFVVVGGEGVSQINPASETQITYGGYNGGANAVGRATGSTTAVQYNASGGGATHIGTFNDTLADHGSTDGLYIVAGGGGGSDYFYVSSSAYANANGGHAGGIEGSKFELVSGTVESWICGNENATQSSGGKTCYYDTWYGPSTFGAGSVKNAGGGGGLYGGAGGQVGGNGGSSYINNPDLYNKAMYCYNCKESAVEGTKTITTNNVNSDPVSESAKKGNGYAIITYVGEIGACLIEPGQTWTFDYTGSSEEFVVPCDGTYKLEVYGASGEDAITSYSGKANITGGKGGYSYGNIILTQDTSLYIGVGGAGNRCTGGYNGGGSAYPDYNVSTAGGGATHIAITDTNRGELKNYANYKEEVLIVAGGGGGGTNANTAVSYTGGSGGGTTGGNGSQASTSASVGGIGGSQTAAGVSSFTAGGFGYGGYQNGVQDYGIRAGGGGGWYGGGAGTKGGGGGSGYIGLGVYNSEMKNGVRTGNGYAQITYLGE